MLLGATWRSTTNGMNFRKRVRKVQLKNFKGICRLWPEFEIKKIEKKKKIVNAFVTQASERRADSVDGGTWGCSRGLDF